MVKLENFINKLNTSERQKLLKFIKAREGSEVGAAFVLYAVGEEAEGKMKKELEFTYPELQSVKEKIYNSIIAYYHLNQSAKKRELFRKVDDISLYSRVFSGTKMKRYLRDLASELKEENLYYFLPTVYRNMQFYSLSPFETKKFNRIEKDKKEFRGEENAILKGRKYYIKFNKAITKSFTIGRGEEKDRAFTLLEELQHLAEESDNPYNKIFRGFSLASFQLAYGGFDKKGADKMLSDLNEYINEIPEDLCRFYFRNILNLLKFFSSESSKKGEVAFDSINPNNALAKNFSFPGGMYLLKLIECQKGQEMFLKLEEESREFINDFLPNKKNNFSCINFYLFKALICGKTGRTTDAKDAIDKVSNLKGLDEKIIEELDYYRDVQFNNTSEDEAVADEEGQYSFFNFNKSGHSIVSRYLEKLDLKLK